MILVAGLSCPRGIGSWYSTVGRISQRTWELARDRQFDLPLVVKALVVERLGDGLHDRQVPWNVVMTLLSHENPSTSRRIIQAR